MFRYRYLVTEPRFLELGNGAAEKTRTSTGVSPQRPQRCASTNSATAARLRSPLYVTFILIYQACFAAYGEKGKKPALQPLSRNNPPKPHDRRENIASQQKASYAMANNYDGFFANRIINMPPAAPPKNANLNAAAPPVPSLPLAWRHFVGSQPYEPLLAEMKAHVTAIRQNEAAEAVWLLEHQAVYTGGTSAKPHDLLTPGNVPISHVGRGGQWTWHGPGQRVAYVMLDLSRRGQDVRALVYGLESWIIASLAAFDIVSQRRDGLPGIWVKSGKSDSGLDKIAAVGIRISHWVSWHGIAINLNPDLAAFDAIVPCGVHDGGVTSFADLGVSASMDDLDHVLKAQFPVSFPNPYPEPVV